MKAFRWRQDKDKSLRALRGVSFVEVLASVYAGGLLDDLEHPNPERYPEQRVMIVNIRGYAYMVPYIETADAIYWKTIIPSRKMTRRYLRR